MEVLILSSASKAKEVKKNGKTAHFESMNKIFFYLPTTGV